jgi:hypothetical protein
MARLGNGHIFHPIDLLPCCLARRSHLTNLGCNTTITIPVSSPVHQRLVDYLNTSTSTTSSGDAYNTLTLGVRLDVRVQRTDEPEDVVPIEVSLPACLPALPACLPACPACLPCLPAGRPMCGR